MSHLFTKYRIICCSRCYMYITKKKPQVNTVCIYEKWGKKKIGVRAIRALFYLSCTFSSEKIELNVENPECFLSGSGICILLSFEYPMPYIFSQKTTGSIACLNIHAIEITENWQENPPTSFCERGKHCWIGKQWPISRNSGQDSVCISEICKQRDCHQCAILKDLSHENRK